VIGCTTAGEITPVGYLEGSLTGVSLSGGGLVTASVLVDGLRDFALGNGDAAARRALAKLREQNVPAPTSANTFGFLLVDGVSMREETLVNAIYRNLGSIQLFGGSAGDGTRYAETYLYHEGEFRADCALFTLIHTTAPFHVFKTEHAPPPPPLPAAGVGGVSRGPREREATRPRPAPGRTRAVRARGRLRSVPLVGRGARHLRDRGRRAGAGHRGPAALGTL